MENNIVASLAQRKQERKVLRETNRKMREELTNNSSNARRLAWEIADIEYQAVTEFLTSASFSAHHNHSSLIANNKLDICYDAKKLNSKETKWLKCAAALQNAIAAMTLAKIDLLKEYANNPNVQRHIDFKLDIERAIKDREPIVAISAN